MDRTTFIKSIETEHDLGLLCNTYFDQLMGLYGLIPNSDFTISAHPNSDESIELKLSFLTEDSCQLISNEIISRLAQSYGFLTIYGHQFNVNVSTSTIEIVILASR